PPVTNNNVKKYFDVILTKEDVIHHKPNPEIVYKALEKLDGIKEEAIVVGDSKKDLGAAQSAGIDSLLFYPEQHKKFYSLEDLKIYNPAYIVSSFEEMKPILIGGF